MGIDAGDAAQSGTDPDLVGRSAAAACWRMIDRTVTAAGARELAARLAAPLTDVKADRRAP